MDPERRVSEGVPWCPINIACVQPLLGWVYPLHACLPTYVPTYVLGYTIIHIHIHIHMHIHISYIHIHIDYISIYIYMYIYIYIYTYIQTYIYIYMYIHAFLSFSVELGPSFSAVINPIKVECLSGANHQGRCWIVVHLKFSNKHKLSIRD